MKLDCQMKRLFLIAGLFTGALCAKAQNSEMFAPKGFDEVKAGVAKGKVDTITYPSKTVGVNRRALVYITPGASKKQKLPVLYLLHGIGGDEKEWFNQGLPHVILDNLFAQGKIMPMMVVLPNGRALKDDRWNSKETTQQEKSASFATFENDLLNDLIPYVEKKYAVLKDRDSRAL